MNFILKLGFSLYYLKALCSTAKNSERENILLLLWGGDSVCLRGENLCCLSPSSHLCTHFAHVTFSHAQSHPRQPAPPRAEMGRFSIRTDPEWPVRVPSQSWNPRESSLPELLEKSHVVEKPAGRGRHGFESQLN